MIQRRPLDVHDYSAGKYFRRLQEFLEEDAVDKRMARIEHELRTVRGVFKRDVVLPKRAWWLGFEEARKVLRKNGSFRRAVTPLMEAPLQTAVKLWRLGKTMPDWKREEFRSRILGDDILTPTLFEIDVAAHFYQLKNEIEWLASKSEAGERTAEFVASRRDRELEVECKAKQADAGRRVERAAFCRAVDQFVPVIQAKSLKGMISITVPARLPVNDAWYEQVMEVLEAEAQPGSQSCEIDDGTLIELELKDADKLLTVSARIPEQVDMKGHPYAHYAVFGEVKGAYLVNPLVFRLESKRQDTFLENVMDSLRNAEAQFTGRRAGLINCHIPEIDSFEGLQSDSALQKMTYVFFENYSRDFIYAISYVTEAKRQLVGNVILSDMPSLTFKSSRYDTQFGEEFEVYG